MYKIVYFNQEQCDEWDDFVRSLDGDVQQSMEWGEFQARVSGRGPFYALGVVKCCPKHGASQAVKCCPKHVASQAVKCCPKHVASQVSDFCPPESQSLHVTGADGGSVLKGRLVASMLLIRHELPFGMSWLNCPRGPVWENGLRSLCETPTKEAPPRRPAWGNGQNFSDKTSLKDNGDQRTSGQWNDNRHELWEILFHEIQKIAAKERAVFLRIEPRECYREYFTEKYDLRSNVIIDTSHPWAGVTEFKLKFGGEIFHYEPAVEYVFRNGWYAALKAVKQIRGGVCHSRQEGSEATAPDRESVEQIPDQASSSRNLSGMTQECIPASRNLSGITKESAFDRAFLGMTQKNFWKSHGFRLAHAAYQPAFTNMIDLRPPESEILAQMKQKGRYNIRLAEKKGVEIVIWPSPDRSPLRETSMEEIAVRPSENRSPLHEAPIDDFYSLLQETTSRDGFSGHGKAFYHDMLATLGEKGMAKLYLAYVKNGSPIVSDRLSDLPVWDDRRGRDDTRIPVAGIIVTFFGKTATYFYGASSNKHRNLMAPYLLQWRAMRDAKKQGCDRYDLFGIAVKSSESIS